MPQYFAAHSMRSDDVLNNNYISIRPTSAGGATWSMYKIFTGTEKAKFMTTNLIVLCMTTTYFVVAEDWRPGPRCTFCQRCLTADDRRMRGCV